MINFKKAKGVTKNIHNGIHNGIHNEKSDITEYYISDIPSEEKDIENDIILDEKIIDTKIETKQVELQKLRCNHNYGELTEGSLCFVDYDCNIKKIYKRPSFGSIIAVDRIITIVQGRNSYYIIVVKNGSIFLESYSLSDHTHELLWSSSISEDASFGNIDLSVSDNDVFLISKDRLMIFRNRFIFRSFPIANIATQKKLITSNGSIAFIAATSSVNFRNIKAGHTYIASFSVNGILESIQLNAETINLVDMTIGIQQDKRFLYITGDFSGQLSLGGNNIGPVCTNASFILCIDVTDPTNLSTLLWYRIIVSKNLSKCSYSGIGGITCIDNYVYTVYRFQQTVAISGPNTDEIQLSRKIDDEGFMLIRLNQESILWRFFPAGNNVEDGVISLTHTSKDVLISGFSSAPIRNNHCGITNHFFMMMFTSDLFEKSYLTFNNAFSSGKRNMIVVNDKIVLSAMYKNVLYSHQFGDITPLNSLPGTNTFILSLSMEFPKLIGILVNLEKCKLIYQGSVETDYLQVGADYYINPNGDLVINPIDGIYYATAISSNILYIK